MKKPTQLRASDEELVAPARKFQCDGLHEHEHPTGPGLKDMQVWTWKFAQAVADGVCNLIHHKWGRRARTRQDEAAAYPTAAIQADPSERPTEQEEPIGAGICKGCKWHRSATDPSHNRIVGQCRYPHIEPIRWECKACRQHAHFGDTAHTFIPGECKAAEAEPRIRGAPRQGQHPRNPAIPAAAAPSSDLQAQVEGGRDLGDEDEAEAVA